MTEISVIIPVYKCAGSIQPLYERLKSSLDSLTDSYEMIFIEDCGGDESWKILRNLASQDNAVRAIQLSRNFGQQAAITAGMVKSVGNWAVLLDCDLEDPPEQVPRLFKKAQEGYDIVLAKRKRKKYPAIRRIATKLYFKCISFLAGVKIDPDLGSLSIISRQVVDAFKSFGEKERHYILMLYWLGFKVGYIEYFREDRYAGSSSYTFRMLLRHALGGILFQTTTLLKWIIYFGFFIALIGSCMLVYYLYVYLMHGTETAGFTTLASLIIITGGLTMLSIGTVGLYIGKIFEEIKSRPLFVIREEINNVSNQ